MPQGACVPLPLPFGLSSFERDLFKPVRAHFLEHHRRSGELLPSLLAMVRAPIDLTRPKVALGDARTHAVPRDK
jgi:hypothetical protein